MHLGRRRYIGEKNHQENTSLAIQPKQENTSLAIQPKQEKSKINGALTEKHLQCPHSPAENENRCRKSTSTRCIRRSSFLYFQVYPTQHRSSLAKFFRCVMKLDICGVIYSKRFGHATAYFMVERPRSSEVRLGLTLC